MLLFKGDILWGFSKQVNRSCLRSTTNLPSDLLFASFYYEMSFNNQSVTGVNLKCKFLNIYEERSVGYWG